jgi:hypothetical protein
VPRPAENVIRLRDAGTSRGTAAASSLPVSPRRLGAAARELDNLARGLDAIIGNPRWSAPGWRAICPPLLVLLFRIRQYFPDLDLIRIGRWPDTDWAIRTRAAFSEVERRLADVRLSMSALASEEPSGVSTVVTFHSDAMLLSEAAQALRYLIADRYPAAVAAS